MEFTVIKSNRKTIGIEIKEEKIIVRAPYYVDDAEINRFLKKNEDWIYRSIIKQQAIKEEKAKVRRLTEEEKKELIKKAMNVIPERVRYYAGIMNITYGRITIRNQKSRWGSCSSKGNLNFNCLLMLAPREVLDAIIVHELCHRKYMNHSRAFYEEVLKAYPEYHRWHRWLKNNGNRLMAMMDN